MPTPQFDHEKLRAYQEALRFIAWVEPLFEKLPAKLAARDQLDRASTSIVLNIAEGNGKRSHPDRCRFFDIARGSTLECAACLDVLVIKQRFSQAEANEGKLILLAIVSLVAGLIARFSGQVEEEPANYETESLAAENEND
ncbi:MAG TPA: four helix bundle protein [Opitutaceae bacterium]|jgi:four helix bundle protein|nr:four helix bundle protein [Opitutaceae bacterium]